MTKLICDQCKKEINPYGTDPKVSVDGLPPSASIALPSGCFHHDFCRPSCMIKWLLENRVDFYKIAPNAGVA